MFLVRIVESLVIFTLYRELIINKPLSLVIVSLDVIKNLKYFGFSTSHNQSNEKYKIISTCNLVRLL